MIAFLALLLVPPGPPAGQEFHFSAMYRLDEQTKLSVWASRTVTEGESGKMRPAGYVRKQYPAYTWTIPQVTARFEPLSGQGTEPKVAIPKLTAPVASGAGNEFEGRYERTGADFQVDWRGCKAGFYQMKVYAKFHGQTMDWTMPYDHQTFYWRPMPTLPKDPYGVGQTLLLINRRPSAFRLAGADELFGHTFKIESAVKQGYNGSNLNLRADTGKTIKTGIGPFNARESLVPVIVDDEVRELRRLYRGHTLNPVSRQMPPLLGGEDSYAPAILPEKNGEAEVVIRDIWRAAISGTLSTPPSILVGYKNYFLSGWYPIYVVLDFKNARDLYGKGNRIGPGPYIVMVPDRWAFERQFSSTSFAQDFKGWKPSPNGFNYPWYPEPGFTPKQVAWVRGWPTYVGPLKDTLAQTTWSFEPDGSPATVFNFRNGKLLAGRDVVSRP